MRRFRPSQFISQATLLELCELAMSHLDRYLSKETCDVRPEESETSDVPRAENKKTKNKDRDEEKKELYVKLKALSAQYGRKVDITGSSDEERTKKRKKDRGMRRKKEEEEDRGDRDDDGGDKDKAEEGRVVEAKAKSAGRPELKLIKAAEVERIGEKEEKEFGDYRCDYDGYTTDKTLESVGSWLDLPAGSSGGEGKREGQVAPWRTAATGSASSAGIEFETMAVEGSGSGGWKDSRRCYVCGGFGHYARDCAQQDVRTCYACGEVGHIAPRCPKVRAAGGVGSVGCFGHQ